MEPSPFPNSIPGAPPPPPEVKVRTMKSDLESMARSGGGAPRFENVAVAGLSAQGESSSQASEAGAPATQGAAAEAPSKSLVGPILVAIVAIVALAVVGYFAYAILYAPAASQVPASSAATP